MTSQKHLKAAVRARMARTGERYTTARRHLAGASIAPSRPGAVPGYRTFGGGRHHDSALLTHVLEANGVAAAHDGRALTEPMVTGLAGGIGFMYFSFSYAGHLPTMTIVPRIHPRPYVLGALERAGIPVRVTETTSVAKAERELSAAVDDGHAPICTVDRASLGHHLWVDSMPGADPYDVVVAGRVGDVLLLDDEALDPVEVDAATFAAARAAHAKSRHRMVVVAPGTAPVDLASAVRPALAVTVHDLTEDVMPGNFAGNFGLRGLAKWADALADRRSKKGWARLFDSGPAFGQAMRRLYDCLTIDLSAPGAMRPLYADFLDEGAAVLGDPALSEAAVLYRRAGAVWSELADTAVAASMAPYRPLAERRLELLLGGGTGDQLRTLVGEVEGLTRALDVSESDRLAELDALAGLAAQLVPLEREACAVLASAAAGASPTG
jgi:hypothetical protein